MRLIQKSCFVEPHLELAMINEQISLRSYVDIKFESSKASFKYSSTNASDAYSYKYLWIMEYRLSKIEKRRSTTF